MRGAVAATVVAVARGTAVAAVAVVVAAGVVVAVVVVVVVMAVVVDVGTVVDVAVDVAVEDVNVPVEVKVDVSVDTAVDVSDDVAKTLADVVMVDVAVVGQVPQPTGQTSATGWPSQVPWQRTLGIRNVWQSLKLSSTSWGRLSQETPSPGLCRQSSTMVEVAVDVAVAEWVDVAVDV